MNLISYALSPLGKYRRIWVKKGENCSVGMVRKRANIGEYRQIWANIGERFWHTKKLFTNIRPYSPYYSGGMVRKRAIMGEKTSPPSCCPFSPVFARCRPFSPVFARFRPFSPFSPVFTRFRPFTPVFTRFRRYSPSGDRALGTNIREKAST